MLFKSVIPPEHINVLNLLHHAENTIVISLLFDQNRLMKFVNPLEYINSMLCYQDRLML